MLEKGALDEFREEWQNYQRCRKTHLAMEDNAVFPLLDEVGGGAISEAGLAQEHTVDLANAEQVDIASTPEDTERAFETWKTFQLDHLAHEEQVMSPLTMKTASTPEGRGQVVHDTLVLPALEYGDSEWYLAFVIERLTTYGTANQSPNVAVRVFAWGLQHASTRGEGTRWIKIIRRNTSKEVWEETVMQFPIDAEGKIKD